MHVAPFGSSRIKDAAQPVLKTNRPGPGQYVPDTVVSKQNWHRDDVVGLARSAFRSGTERLHADRASYVENPGPGNYVTAPGWIKKDFHAALPRGERPVAFVRKASCPSVPDRMRSYGYDEHPDGSLVAQVPGHVRTGVGVDRPGPADYDPDKTTVLRADHGTDFSSRSRSERQLFAARDGPGPGAYDPGRGGPATAPMRPRLPKSQGWRGRRQASTGTGSFASGVQRFKDPADAPGPGAYDPRGGAASPERRGKAPAFGASDARTYQKDTFKMRGAPTYTKNPGPGAYEQRGMRAKKVSASFRSTSPRFPRGRQAAPGPGAYAAEVPGSVQASVDHMLASRTGAFGTSDPRFQNDPSLGPTSPGHERSPGPAAYHADVPQVMRRYRDQGLASSSFSTQTDRFRTRDETVYIRDEATGEEVEYRKPVPGPGTYRLPDSLDRARARPAKGRDDDAFLGSSQRLPGDRTVAGGRIEDLPGPGAYDPGAEAGPRAPPHTVEWHDSRRFQGYETLAPGPGSYELVDGNSMVTKTYNVTYDGAGAGAPPGSPPRPGASL